MSKIKSAVELALEKTSGIEVDRDALKKRELEKKGRLMASLYLSQKKDFSDELNGLAQEDMSVVKGGIAETLLANMVLPRKTQDVAALQQLGEAFALISSDKGRTAELFTELGSLFQQFIDSGDQLLESLKQQLGPQLEMKARQMEQQTGQRVDIRPESDPEFIQILNEQMVGMEQQFKEVLDRGKAELKNTL